MAYSIKALPLAAMSFLLLTSCCKGTSKPDNDTPGTHPTATSHPTTTPTGHTTGGTAGTTTAAPTGTHTPPPGKGKAKSIHLALGIPTDADASDDYLMVKPQYALSYNKNRNDPNWVASNLDAGYFGDVPRFAGKFMADDALPKDFYHVKHDDYTGSGYDRGHMVRSEERTKTAADNEATFLTDNLLPQYHDLNAGPWLRLEDYCQSLAQKENKELYIYAGGVFAAKPPTIGHGVAVPDSTFKIVVVLEKGQSVEAVNDRTRVIAVNMPNKKGILNEPWGQYRTSVDEIEKLTGYDFMPDVPEAVQAVIESKVDAGPTGH